jgi:Amt family ammonium transporter
MRQGVILAVLMLCSVSGYATEMMVDSVAAAIPDTAVAAVTDTAAALATPPVPMTADSAAALAVAETGKLQTNLNYVWTILAAILVFFMQAGFALVETGFTRAKNSVNIIMKNFSDVSIGTVFFFLLGFGLMFGTPWNGLLGTDGFLLNGITGQDESWIYAFFLFQAVFAATAATIVSGAMAERTSYVAYLFFSVVMSAVIYPIFGSWAWGSLFNGGGWLESYGFIDFAGSTVVHSVGGWASLAGVIAVGPRAGKFVNGVPQAIKGHSLPLSALGVFILWFGWFGFNAGSTTTGDTSIALIALNTFLASCTGFAGAVMIAWIQTGKPNAGLALNGVLGGLVGITAGCANVSPVSALLIGLVAGVLVVLATDFIDKYVDDAVGAIAVHGVCGVWGTLAAGIFNAGGFSIATVGVQALGAAAAFLWTFPISFLTFKLINLFVPLRVDAELEAKGLDVHEHDVHAYPEFMS